MKQFLIFAVILLATFSMVNAAPLRKRVIQFGPCPPIPKLPKQPDLIQQVTVTPDPVVPGQDESFKISTTLSSEITTDYQVVIGFADLTGKLLQDPSSFPIGKDVPPGQTFEATEVVKAPEGATAPPGYAIAVGIATLANPPSIIGCTLAIVASGDSAESYPIASYPIASYPIAGLYPID